MSQLTAYGLSLLIVIAVAMLVATFVSSPYIALPACFLVGWFGADIPKLLIKGSK